MGDLDRLLYDPPHTHQAEALEWTSRDGKSLAITTGTGSGKTESFLLPMLAVGDGGGTPTDVVRSAGRSGFDPLPNERTGERPTRSTPPVAW